MTKAFKISATVLLLCGAVSSARADAWRLIAPMNTPRESHTLTLLPNGKVLVAGGGYGGTNQPLVASCELYDPATGAWTPTGSMHVARAAHTATLLPNGKVLIAGGTSGYYNLASTELYNPATGTWTITGSLKAGRGDHTATLLPNGKVLVTGGHDTNGLLGLILGTAELYDPTTGSWKSTGSMNSTRERHTATLLANGLVLVAGGTSLDSAELYNPTNETWTPTGSLNNERGEHTATLLPNGQVLVAGGTGSYILNSAEIYDPASGLWIPTGSMNFARTLHTAKLLPTGKVFVAGNGDGVTTELYDPAIGTWTTNGVMNVPHDLFAAATLLANGQIIITGGNGYDEPLATAEIYGPLVAPPLHAGLFGNTVTVWWPATPGWVLQQNSNLTNLTGWSSPSGITTANGTNYLNVTPPSDTSFYRLSSQ